MAMASNRGGLNFKVVLLGEGCVGKTSLVLRFVEDRFTEKHISTLQASFLTKKVTIDGQRANLSIWDTAGQERFHALGPIYYRDSHGAILVYDITNEESFLKVKTWVRELKKMLGDDICLAIAGNKIDLENDRTVVQEMAEAYAREVGAFHGNTSAKFNEGVEEVFMDLCVEMIRVAVEKAEATDDGAESASNGRHRNEIQIADDEEGSQRVGKSCCG